jgi:hypothetical protein
MSLRRQRRTSLPQLPPLPTPARAPSLTLGRYTVQVRSLETPASG